MSSSPPDDDDLVPISVRLGQVVPPEDPEDWTKPLTWVAAAGMLLAPLVAIAWFWLATPDDVARPLPGTWLLAGALAAGAALTGATQIGALRALTATVAAALFAGLATVLVGAAMAGQRQVGEASPTVAQAIAAVLAGLAGASAAAGLAPMLVAGARWRRAAVPALIAVAVSALVVPLLFRA
ncbi:MAG TPA: hypothetical protein VF013_05310 [Candidatus Limnocylindria bacterium]